MGRTTPIRITKNDANEYAKLVRNTKSKIRNVQKKYGIGLEGAVEIPSLNDFKTRKEYNEWKSQVKSFTNRNNQKYQFVKNEHGVVASKSQVNKIHNDRRVALALANKTEKEIAKQDLYAGGKKRGTVKQKMQQMGKPLMPAIAKPKPFDFNKVENQADLDKIAESMEKRSKPETFSDRTAKMKRVFERELEENFNSDAQELLELLEYVPDDDFLYLYIKNEEFDYSLYYPPEGVADAAKHSLDQLEKIVAVMKRYWAGKENMDLKNF